MPDADVLLELPADWFANPMDGDRHRRLYASIWLALGDLDVTVRPVPLRFGADSAPRLSKPGQLLISFHSRGPAGHILRIKESYLPPYYTVDRMGYSGFSELARHPDRFRDAIDAMPDRAARTFVEAVKRDTIAANLSKYDQPRAGGGHLPDRFVFQPLQTIDDPVAGLARMDQLDVLEALALSAAPLGWSVVFKRHPLCTAGRVSARLASLTAAYPNLVASDASVHSLIAGAEAVVGANSGVLFEALLHGAHVVSFGASDYACVTTPISGPEEIAGAMLGRGRVDRAAQCRFLAWYLQLYCVSADDVGAIRNRIGAALAGLDRTPQDHVRRQQDLFETYAEREAIRRRTVLNDTAPEGAQ